MANPLRKTDGTCVYSDGSSQTAATGVPGGSAPVAAGIFLAADGRLIDGGNNGNVLTSNVGSYGQLIAGTNGWIIPVALATIAPQYLEGGTATNPSGVPLKATPVAAGIFLTSDGRVIDGGNNGQVVATQVSAAGQLITGPSGWRMPLKKSDGTCVYTGGAGEIAAVGVPSGSTPVAAGIFLAPDGRVIDGGSNGQVLATNIASTGQLITGQVGWRLPMKKNDGSCVYTDGVNLINANGVPTGSTPVAAGIFLASDGRVIDGGNNGQILATNVAATGQLFTGQVGWRLPLKKDDGTCVYTGGTSEVTATGVPTGSKPVAAAIFLAPDGRLIDGGNNGQVLANNVTATGQAVSGGSGWRLPYSVSKTGC